jgi:hypothetical protein
MQRVQYSFIMTKTLSKLFDLKQHLGDKKLFGRGDDGPQ